MSGSQAERLNEVTIQHKSTVVLVVITAEVFSGKMPFIIAGLGLVVTLYTPVNHSQGGFISL